MKKITKAAALTAAAAISLTYTVSAEQPDSNDCQSTYTYMDTITDNRESKIENNTFDFTPLWNDFTDCLPNEKPDKDSVDNSLPETTTKAFESKGEAETIPSFSLRPAVKPSSETTTAETETVTEETTKKLPLFEITTERQTEAVTEKQTEAVTEKQTETTTERQAETTTERQTETTTERQTEITTKETITQTTTEVQTETTTEAAVSSPSVNTSMAQQILKLVNEERTAAGLSSLTLDSSLNSAASLKAQDMADNNYFSHTSPTYGTPFQMLNYLGISYKSAGENIAKGQKSAEAVMTAWMNSEGHKANILSSNYGKLGVGYVNQNGTAYWVQIFTD